VDDVDSLKGVIRQMVPKAIEGDGNHSVKAAKKGVCGAFLKRSKSEDSDSSLRGKRKVALALHPA
jgi:hypothetical protein